MTTRVSKDGSKLPVVKAAPSCCTFQAGLLPETLRLDRLGYRRRPRHRSAPMAEVPSFGRGTCAVQFVGAGGGLNAGGVGMGGAGMGGSVGMLPGIRPGIAGLGGATQIQSRPEEPPPLSRPSKPMP